MAFSPRGTFTQEQSLFGSWVQDIQATDLPLGASPDNSDCFFLPGGIFTRPALKKVLATPVAGSPTILSNADFGVPTGDDLMMFLDSTGTLYSNLADSPTVTTPLSIVEPGVQFAAETAFGKQWYAFYSYLQSAAFTDNPFVGVDIPLYFNGTNLYRVTSDAPGVSPNFGQVAVAPIPIVANSPSSSTLNISNVIATGRHGYFDPTTGKTEFWFDFLVFTCTTAVPLDWATLPVVTAGVFSADNPDYVNGPFQIVSVSGNTFTVSYGGPSVGSGSGGTATVSSSGNYMSRSKNVVTAYFGATKPVQYQVGFWAQFLNNDGSLIVGPNWPITSIKRDATGLVTVIVSEQLTNLPVGTVLNINASDTTDFPAGPQTVTQVLSITATQTVFTYQTLDASVAASSGGSVFQQWSPTAGINGNAAQITKVGFDPNLGWFVQFFQLGPDGALPHYGGATPQIQIAPQLAAGQRSGVCIFASQDGALTAPSVPVIFSTSGGQSLLGASQIPIGPPGTSRRILAFTPAAGANYYYIEPSNLATISATSGIARTGTIINDNVTTAALLDFSDVELTSGTQIDIAGNDLFEQIVLAPMLGVIEYQGRMAWWGEVNNVKNFVNPGFDGGYLPPTGDVSVYGRFVTWSDGVQFKTGWAGATIVINGTPYVIASVQSSTQLTLATTPTGLAYGTFPFTVYTLVGTQPLGWDTSQGDGAGSLVNYSQDATEFGFAYQMLSGFNNHIQQGCAFDFFGGPILQANTPYIVRLKGKTVGTLKTGNLIVDVYSATAGGVIATATFPISGFSPTMLSWASQSFDNTLPLVLPPDAILEIYLMGTVLGDSVVTIDELEVIYENQPVAFDQMRLSYFQNPFGYDALTGVLSVDPAENLAAAFRQRGNLYIVSEESLFQTVNNGSGEPDTWSVTQYVGRCGAAGPNAVTFGEEFAIWAGRYGIREFTGDPSAKKLSQEFAKTWESINWTAETTIWVANDTVNRLLFCGIPTGSAATPNLAVHMSYRLNDSAYNVPDPIHVSSYSGKMIVTDLGRRWSPWNLPLNCAALCKRQLPTGIAKTIVFGGGNGLSPGSGTGFGNLYTLDTPNYWPLDNSLDVWNCVDDDYGTINAYYTTSFFLPRELEQNPQVEHFRKNFKFFSIHATGVGSLKITPYLDALTQPQRVFPLTPLSLADPGFDLEFHPILKGNRCAYRLEAYIGPPGVGKAFAITQLTVSAIKDNVFPVRGTVFAG